MSSTSKIGRFFVLSAPSGAGKTTLVNRLLKDIPHVECSISCTTRKPRQGEVDGVDYYFISTEKFQTMIGLGEFFEYEEVHGYFYGTPKGPLMERRQQGQDTILDLDTRGALSVKKSFPDSLTIFLMPPSLEVLEERLRKRQTENEASLQRRLKDAQDQLLEKEKFDRVVINDKIDRAYEEVKNIILNSLQ
ncbi:MAG: guanylate kinase [Deltaproteobacteria bacterium]|nr:MAG: guanylate kinase [Deltaproteobacteria bacterium]